MSLRYVGAIPNDDVERVLWSVAEERARQHGYPFGGGSEVHLRQFIVEGAQTMVQEGITEDSPQMNEAKEHLRVFVDEMANAVEEQGLSEFHEPTFFAARQKLCPGFFPFC